MLGIPFDKARNLLNRKIIRTFLFERYNATCCRCATKIEEAEEFHIDHINGYLDCENPLEKFLDLQNVGLSHVRCNLADSANKREAISQKVESRIKTFNGE